MMAKEFHKRDVASRECASQSAGTGSLKLPIRDSSGSIDTIKRSHCHKSGLFFFFFLSMPPLPGENSWKKALPSRWYVT